MNGVWHVDEWTWFVILELSHGKEIIPIVLPFIHEEAKVLLQLLVDTFGLAICLGV